MLLQVYIQILDAASTGHAWDWRCPSQAGRNPPHWADLTQAKLLCPTTLHSCYDSATVPAADVLGNVASRRPLRTCKSQSSLCGRLHRHRFWCVSVWQGCKLCNQCNLIGEWAIEFGANHKLCEGLRAICFVFGDGTVEIDETSDAVITCIGAILYDSDGLPIACLVSLCLKCWRRNSCPCHHMHPIFEGETLAPLAASCVWQGCVGNTYVFNCLFWEWCLAGHSAYIKKYSFVDFSDIIHPV